MPETVTQDQAEEFISQMLAVAAERSVVWDFDGVVADTEPLQDASYRVLAGRRGWTPRDNYFLDLVGRTEEQIWTELVRAGFPIENHLSDVLPELAKERKAAFVELAAADLKPTWVAGRLMPALAEVAAAQVIVSNGDPDVIEMLLNKWGLADLVLVARRGRGMDKTALLRQHCSGGSVLLEDNAGWIEMGRSLGAITVGVRHSYNANSVLPADYLVAL